jgi:hypothetical protein
LGAVFVFWLAAAAPSSWRSPGDDEKNVYPEFDTAPIAVAGPAPNISIGSEFCFDAFSSREPVSTSLENALDGDVS